jgi:hypothetical protein
LPFQFLIIPGVFLQWWKIYTDEGVKQNKKEKKKDVLNNRNYKGGIKKDDGGGEFKYDMIL